VMTPVEFMGRLAILVPPPYVVRSAPAWRTSSRMASAIVWSIPDLSIPVRAASAGTGTKRTGLPNAAAMISTCSAAPSSGAARRPRAPALPLRRVLPRRPRRLLAQRAHRREEHPDPARRATARKAEVCPGWRPRGSRSRDPRGVSQEPGRGGELTGGWPEREPCVVLAAGRGARCGGGSWGTWRGGARERRAGQGLHRVEGPCAFVVACRHAPRRLPPRPADPGRPRGIRSLEGVTPDRRTRSRMTSKTGSPVLGRP
jgi:hypothetical protein